MPRVVRVNNHSNLSESVYEMIKLRLLGGQLASGTRLIEKVVAAQLGVSRTPVREALSKLEEEGLVEIISHHGTLVADISSKDIEEIYQIREALESLAVKLALPHLSSRKLQELARLHEDCRHFLEKGDLYPFIKVDKACHNLLVRLSNNKRLIHLMGNLNDQTRLGRPEPFSIPGRAEKALEEHLIIIEAILEGDVRRAEDLVKQHNRNAKDNVLRCLKMQEKKLTVPLGGGPMKERLSTRKLVGKARRPEKFASKYHSLYHGKIGVELKAPVRDYSDFAIWYTPGVAEPCKAIRKDSSAVFKYTDRANLVAIVTDGTRVLGLGDIGPEGALPVMEGKSMLFKYLGGVDAFPICLDTKDPDEIIRAVKWLAPTFGGINLEDIAKPKCFYILDRLRKELDIPVWHDDQQGTALVTLAALMSALKVVGKRIDDISMAFVGAGSANVNCVRYTILAGADPDRLMVVDSKGILHQGRSDLKETEPTKWDICEKTNRENRTGGIKQAMKGADVCIALSRPGPGVIKKEWVGKMANDAIVFTCANPIPEIWPWEAKEAGARIMATGRSDFPNQVNNSLGFPAVFRGALDVAARRITDGMCLAASLAISGYAEKKGLSDDYIIPSMGETDMFVEEAVAVGLKAIEEGVGRLDRSAEELRESASSAIKVAQETVKLRMERGLIKPLPN